MPKTFLMLVLAVGILLFVKEYFQNRKTQSEGRPSDLPAYPFTRQSALFSTAERNLWRELTQAAGEDNCVFGKVRLADLVRVRPDLNSTDAKIVQDEIGALSVDFVICRRSNFTIAVAVMLTNGKRDESRESMDSTHTEGALAAAGVPLLRLSPDKEYTVANLRTELRRATLASAAAQTTPAAQVGQQPPITEHAIPAASRSETCPTCGAELVKRRVSGGRMDGNQVLACPNYPACKHVLPLTIPTAVMG